MIGCASSRPIISESSNHEREHTNTQSHVENVIDSTVIDREKEIVVRNDTVYITRNITQYKWRERFVVDSIIDTLYVNLTDTFTIVKTEYKDKIVPVEKEIAPFVRNSCIALWIIVGVAILLIVVWITRNFATGKFTWIGLITKLFKK